MTAKKPDQHQDDLAAAKEAAEQALQAAQPMPVGPERIEALRKAGKMRFDASERRCATEKENGRANVGQKHEVRYGTKRT